MSVRSSSRLIVQPADELVVPARELVADVLILILTVDGGWPREEAIA